MVHMDMASLAKEFSQLHDKGNSDAVLNRIAEVWDRIREVYTVEAGTICRVVMLALFRRKAYREGDVWKARALTRFTIGGSPNGVATLLVTEALRTIDIGGPLEVALAILDEMEPLMAQPNQPQAVAINPSNLRRVLHEKRAYCLCRLGRFAEAAAAYEEAKQHAAGNARSLLKVEGGRALSLYLSDPSGPAAEEAIRLTQAVCDECAGVSDLEWVLRTASKNLAIMRSRLAKTMDEFEHYDIR